MLFLSPGITLYCCAVVFILGTCVGSFLNCAAWRIVHGEAVSKGRSHCDLCGHVLGAGDLVPIVSFLASRGRCRYCGGKLSVGHVWAEAVTGVCFVLILLKFDISLQALEMLLFAALLMGCAFADLEGYIIPDRFIVLGICLRIPFFFLLPQPGRQLADGLIGGFVIGGGLLLLVLGYERLRNVEAMGGGDIKLLFLTGLYLGWAKNLLCLLAACVFGILFGLAFQKRRGETGEKVFPWGPSITAAAILCALVGDELIGAYLGLF